MAPNANSEHLKRLPKRQSERPICSPVCIGYTNPMKPPSPTNSFPMMFGLTGGAKMPRQFTTETSRDECDAANYRSDGEEVNKHEGERVVDG